MLAAYGKKYTIKNLYYNINTYTKRQIETRKGKKAERQWARKTDKCS